MAIIGDFGSAPDYQKQGYRGQGYVVHGTEAEVLKIFRANDVVLVKGAAVVGTEAEHEFYPMLRVPVEAPTENTIGNFIKRHRLNKNLTQVELARMTGVNTVALDSYEKGSRKPDAPFILKLQTIFGAQFTEQLAAELGC